MDKKPLSPSNHLVSLNPMLVENGVMRMDGRSVRSPTLSPSERCPIILPYKSRFAKPLVEYIHVKSVHGGT